MGEKSLAPGLQYPTVYRFYHGERDVYLETANKLAEYFQMRLTKPVKLRHKGEV